MKKVAWVVLGLAIAGTAGCTQTRPELRMEEKGENPAAEEQDLGHKVKVVTAEPATSEDKQEGDAPTAEDKPGAVAVKMEY